MQSEFFTVDLVDLVDALTLQDGMELSRCAVGVQPMNLNAKVKIGEIKQIWN